MTLTDLQALASTEEGRERIRVMVAELMGDTCRICKNTGEYMAHGEHAWTRIVNYRSIQQTPTKCQHDYPRYTESLDACAEFEAGLTGARRANYKTILRAMTGSFEENCFASALHRCVAFILTKQSTKGAE